MLAPEVLLRLLPVFLALTAALSLGAAFFRSSLVRLAIHVLAIVFAAASGVLGADWVYVHCAHPTGRPSGRADVAPGLK